MEVYQRKSFKKRSYSPEDNKNIVAKYDDAKDRKLDMKAFWIGLSEEYSVTERAIKQQYNKIRRREKEAAGQQTALGLLKKPEVSKIEASMGSPESDLIKQLKNIILERNHYKELAESLLREREEVMKLLGS